MQLGRVLCFDDFMAVELGVTNEKNFKNLSEILNATFPVKYDADIFAALDRRLCQFAYVGDFLLGCVPCRRSENSLYVFALATLAPYRRMGVASALLAWTETRARALGCTEVSLHVRASEATSLKFYLARGFLERSRIDDYYPMAGDSQALLLAKTLTT